MRRLRPPTLRDTEESTAREPNKAPIKGPAVLAGAVGSGQLSLAAAEEGAFSQFTTTTTGSFQSIGFKPVTVTATAGLLHVSLTTQAKHSAAGASFTLEIDLTPASGTPKTFSRLASIYLATADQWLPIGGVHTIDLTLNTVSAGRWDIDLWVKNNTAGTLTIGDTTAATRYWSAFVYGRSHN